MVKSGRRVRVIVWRRMVTILRYLEDGQDIFEDVKE